MPAAYLMNMRILLIEDDPESSAYLARALGEAGHVADKAADGETGGHMAQSGRYDVLVVDRMLPRLDGLTMLKRLRADGIDTPAIILSALGQVDDRVEGLRAGGDDYLSKPYAFSELLARIETLSRRKRQGDGDMQLRVADLELDRLSRTVRRAGKSIVVQPREYRLLEYMMRNAGKVVTRTMLLEDVWDYHFDPQTNVIDVHMSRLRAKIDRDFGPPLLHTVRGAGYVLREP
jgi:two-component system OmpR family response regulator